MLLLVTILLVVVGTISLVIGYAQSSLLPIYVSIACSVLAAGVLLIFSRMTAKSQKVDASAGGPAPLDYSRPEPAERTQPVPAFSGGGQLGRSSSSEAFAPEAGRDAEPASRYGTGFDEVDEVDEVDESVPDDDFPIERYDSRRVGEILPLLAELDVDELDLVREHEERGKARATVLARIDQLIDQLEAEDRDEAEHRFDTAAEADQAPAPQARSWQPAAPQPVSVAALPEDDDYFPIEDYEDLRAGEILPLLPELDEDELEMVRGRERSGSARASILHRIDELVGGSTTTAAVPVPEEASASQPELEPEPEPEAEPEPVPLVSEVPTEAPARAASGRPAKARASRGGSSKMVVSGPRPSKAPARASKVAEPTVAKVAKAPERVTKAPAKATRAAVAPKAPVGKAPAPAPRKSAPAGKAPAVKAPAAKAPVGKVVPAKAPAGKAVPAKAPAGKAVPAKRAQKGASGTSSTPAAKATKRATKR